MIPSFDSSLRAGVLVAVAALLAVPVAGASTAGFSGKACSLFTAKQVATIVGDADTGKYRCVPGKSVQTPAGPANTAKAGPGSTAKGGFFSLLVIKYKSAAIESLARKQVTRGLKPVKGVGDWAYTRISMSPVVGGNADAGEFAFGAKGYGVLITVRARLKKTVNQPALKALAKRIVGEL